MTEKQKKDRVDMLCGIYSKEIMQLLDKGVPKRLETRPEKQRISYAEAVSILEYTISELKNKPISFT